VKDAVDEKYSPAHIRNVSEIGLVFPIESFQKDVDNFRKLFPIPHFDKQLLLAAF